MLLYMIRRFAATDNTRHTSLSRHTPTHAAALICLICAYADYIIYVCRLTLLRACHFHVLRLMPCRLSLRHIGRFASTVVADTVTEFSPPATAYARHAAALPVLSPSRLMLIADAAAFDAAAIFDDADV